MSIKLICSDIDGTLLQYGKKEREDRKSTRLTPVTTISRMPSSA